MRWKCKKCGKIVAANSETAKPSGGNCEKNKDGKIKPHNWVNA